MIGYILRIINYLLSITFCEYLIISGKYFWLKTLPTYLAICKYSKYNQ